MQYHRQPIGTDVGSCLHKVDVNSNVAILLSSAGFSESIYSLIDYYTLNGKIYKLQNMTTFKYDSAISDHERRLLRSCRNNYIQKYVFPNFECTSLHENTHVMRTVF